MPPVLLPPPDAGPAPGGGRRAWEPASRTEVRSTSPPRCGVTVTPWSAARGTPAASERTIASVSDEDCPVRRSPRYHLVEERNDHVLSGLPRRDRGEDRQDPAGAPGRSGESWLRAYCEGNSSRGVATGRVRGRTWSRDGAVRCAEERAPPSPRSM